MTNLSLSLNEIESRIGQPIAAQSWIQHNNLWLWWHEATANQPVKIGILGHREHPMFVQFPGHPAAFNDQYALKICPPDHATALALRNALPWLSPQPLGLVTSFGFGDRLGLAARGHVRAIRRTQAEFPGFSLAPIFAQQSIRELVRTDRTPDQVVDAATIGAFAEGWREAVGADADHLKTEDDIDRCAAAGFSFFTLDPSAFVQDQADDMGRAALASAAQAIPWERLETSFSATHQRYVDQVFDIGVAKLTPTAHEVARAVVKYGGAIAQVVTLYRHLVLRAAPFEIEVSVDETETPTSAFEHFYFAAELRRLGVNWVSLAPRFVGRFEKGVDYIGDLTEIVQDFQRHAAIARTLGPYKLSLHSGSDKFSIYAAAAAAADGLLHVKTAGTSYLEALRVIAQWEPGLFRTVTALAWDRYEVDRMTYHVSIQRDLLPALDHLNDDQLSPLLENHHVRQVLHVTFGTVLRQYRCELLDALARHDNRYRAGLELHFYRHLAPIAAAQQKRDL